MSTSNAKNQTSTAKASKAERPSKPVPVVDTGGAIHLPVPAARLLLETVMLRDRYPGATEQVNYAGGLDGSHFNVNMTADGDVTLEVRPPQGAVQAYQNARDALIKKRNGLQGTYDSLKDAESRGALIEGEEDRMEAIGQELEDVKAEIAALVPVECETQSWSVPKGPRTIVVTLD